MKLLVGLVFLFAGLDVMILLSHLNRLFGATLFAIGLAILSWGYRGSEREEKKPSDNLAGRLIHAVTLNGRLADLMPVGGVAAIILVVAYNLATAGAIQLGSNDYVALLLGAILLAYNYVPSKYAAERDFAFLFFAFLFAILVVPTTIYSLKYGALTEANTDTPWTEWLLTRPTSGLLSIFGVDNWLDPNRHNIINYIGTDGFQQAVSIGLSCTGLYSVTIFISAFAAFVAIEYKKFDARVGVLLLVGVVMAWYANVIRMALIVLVGVNYGPEALTWTHNNAGIFIFMAWILLFWGIMFKVLGVGNELPMGRRRRCAACSKLVKTQKFAECECGRTYHAGCVPEDLACASCGSALSHDSEEPLAP
ncbi:MAG: archaeosortase/exosortase family protein [Methanobacteriota archaeon]